MHSAHQLLPIVLLLATAVCVVALFRRLKLSSILGYLCAGVAIGPYGFKVFQDTAATESVAEFGVVFLLFVIGLELSLDRLQRMRTHVFSFGGAQVLLTGLLFGLIARALGVSGEAALIVGGGLALSSSAIVLQLISEGNEKTTQTGRLSLAALILQDLAVIPLLVLVPLLASTQSSILYALTEASIKAIAGIVIIIFLGRVLLRPLLRTLAAHDHDELFVATTMLIVLGLSYVSTLAGMSPALGAFMGGLLVAETEFKPQVEADILPFKSLLLGLFFITVGMGIDINFIAEKLAIVIGLTAALITLKAAIVYGLSRLFSFERGPSMHTALLIAQGSEFAFVLFSLAYQKGLLDSPTQQLLLAIISLSMVATPFLHMLGKRAGAYFEERDTAPRALPMREITDLCEHIIIAGFGRVGRIVSRMLEEEHISCVALDMNATNVGEQREKGQLVYYGDASRGVVLKAVGIQRAQAIILTHGDARLSRQTILAVRAINPTLPIIVRAHNIDEVIELEGAGATLAVAEMFETSLQLGGALLKELGVPDMEISRVLEVFRAQDYAMTRKESAAHRPEGSTDFAI